MSQDGLRAGAQALIEARGDIGESLFAASSGLKGVIGVRFRLLLVTAMGREQNLPSNHLATRDRLPSLTVPPCWTSLQASWRSCSPAS
ncbi:MAG: AAA family ATPase [Burkholderiaceae bacterium]